MRGDAVDLEAPTQVSAVAVRQHVGKFTGQSQMSPAAAKVNANTIFKGLSLLIMDGLLRNHPFFVQFAQVRAVFQISLLYFSQADLVLTYHTRRNT